MIESKDLARQISTDRDFEGLGYFRVMLQDRLVVVAEGETAAELLPLVENFEALMEAPEEVQES